MLHSEQIRIDPPYLAALRECGLDHVEPVLGRVAGRIVAWSRTTDTLHVPRGDGAPGFFVKRHYYAPWRKRIRGMFRGTFFGAHRGRAEYRWLNTLRSLGIPAVRPVAWGVRRTAHFVSACFLITEEVPEAVNLTTFAGEVAAGRRSLSEAQRAAMVHRLAEQVAAMHAAGFAHGQLFWRNILVRLGPDGLPEYFFLDAEPPRRWLGRSERVWQEELAALLTSSLPFTTPRDRVRFAHRYYNVRRLGLGLRASAKWIESAARGWQRHEQQRIKMNGLFEAWNGQLGEEARRHTRAAEAGTA
jgi:hypothetical protein